jgi:hypothetical protein
VVYLLKRLISKLQDSDLGFNITGKIRKKSDNSKKKSLLERSAGIF